MEAIGVTQQQLETAARDAGVRLYQPRSTRKGWRFTLKTKPHHRKLPAPYRRLSQRQRHRKDGSTYYPTVPGAVCWHGHRDFFRALYTLAPEAEIKTAKATYKSAEHFERTYRDTRWTSGEYYQAPGSLDYFQACTCERPA